MRHKSFAAVAAALMLGGASLAYAQSGQERQSRTEMQSRMGQQSQMQGQQDRTFDRSELRRHLRESGFRNIRILDTTFLVEALTSDGRPVMMFIDPPSRQSTLFRDDQQRRFRDQQHSGRSDQDRQRQRFGQSDQDGQRFGQTSSGQQMSESRIRSMLQARGFSDIDELQRDGNAYTASAEWHGEDVDVRVDARTGRILSPTQLRESQIRNMLEDEGWSNVSNIERNGNVYLAEADRNGTKYEVSVDARTGTIIDQERADDDSESSN